VNRRVGDVIVLLRAVPHSGSREKKVMSPHTKKLVSAVVFGVLWIVSMLWWSGSFDQHTVLITVIMGVIAGLLWYLLFDRFSKLFNG
jgi:hypothetical protein